MKLARFLVLAVFAASLFLTGSSIATAKPRKPRKPRLVKKLLDAELMNELKVVHFQLSKANTNYKGHRANSRTHIKSAINSLAAEAKANGQTIKSPALGGDPQPVSDAQLKSALKNVGTVLNQINNLKATKGRQTAAEHLVNAISELKLALAVN
jgi:hypothetical protein